MSPSRRKQFVPGRRRAEVIVAAAVGVAIVAGTLLLIWLMRPGPVGVPGKGGIFSRQPRFTLLLVLAASAIGGVVGWVLRRARSPRFGVRGSIAIGGAAVVVLAVVGGILWPGGVIRHWPSAPKLPVASVPSSSTPATTARTGTTVKTSTTAKSTSSSTPTTKGG